MFNSSAELQRFYEKHVRLGKERHSVLAGHRDINLSRLRSGLIKLGEKDGTSYPSFIDHHDQGSYAMHTLNQHPDGDYDIDVAIIFNEKDLPNSPLEARKRVVLAMNESGVNFAQAPEARTNAVTIWYAEGHHVDFAVYRQRVEGGIEFFEHASTEWKRRDPLEINKWFQSKEDALSPRGDLGASVAPKQLRRIVRLVKAFTRSRSSWGLPGGMITTALVVECYQSDPDRDDVAFVKTLRTLSARLSSYTHVINPVDSGAVLTGKTEWANQVIRLRDRLTEKIPSLDKLDDTDCDEEAMRSVWLGFFNHSFWEPEESKTSFSDTSSVQVSAVRDEGEEFLSDMGIRENIGYTLRINANVIQHGFRPFFLRGTVQPLRKERRLEFVIEHCNAPLPYQIKWKIKNLGEEARRRNDLRGKIYDDQGCRSRREATKYAGEHYAECYVIKDGVCVAKDRIDVPIGLS